MKETISVVVQPVLPALIMTPMSTLDTANSIFHAFALLHWTTKGPGPLAELDSGPQSRLLSQSGSFFFLVSLT